MSYKITNTPQQIPVATTVTLQNTGNKEILVQFITNGVTPSSIPYTGGTYDNAIIPAGAIVSFTAIAGFTLWASLSSSDSGGSSLGNVGSISFNDGNGGSVPLPIEDINVATTESENYSIFSVVNDTSVTTTPVNVSIGTLFNIVWGDIVDFFNNISAKVISLINLVNTQQVSINNILAVLTAGSETLATFSTATQTITGTTFVQVPLAEKTTTGNIVAGNYVIPSASQVGAIVKLIATLNYQQSAPTGTGNVQLVNLGTVANPTSIILGTRAFVTGNTNVQQISINSGIVVGSTRSTTSVLAGDRIQLQANDTGTGTINLVGGTGATANNTILMFLTATGVSLSQSQYKLINVAKNPSDYSSNLNSILNEYCTSDIYGLSTLNPAFPAGTFTNGYNYVVDVVNTNQITQIFEVFVNGKSEFIRRTAPLGSSNWTGVLCYSNYLPSYSSAITLSQMQRVSQASGSVYTYNKALTSGLNLYRAILNFNSGVNGVAQTLITGLSLASNLLSATGTIYCIGNGGVMNSLIACSSILVNNDGNASIIYMDSSLSIKFIINSTSTSVSNYTNQPVSVLIEIVA